MVEQRGEDVCIHPMGADQAKFLPGNPQPGREGLHRGDAGKHLYWDAVLLQQGEELPRTAVKAGVAAVGHHCPAASGVALEEGENLP